MNLRAKGLVDLGACIVADQPFECDLCACAESCCVPESERNVSEEYQDRLSPHASRKLDPALVLDLRQSEGSYRGLGIKYGVSASTVRKIRLGKTYKDLKGGE